MGHPGVSEAQGIAVPDERLREIACACVILRDPLEVSADDLLSYCRGKLANFKVPRHFLFMLGYPMTPSGKVQQFKLREQAEEALRLGVSSE